MKTMSIEAYWEILEDGTLGMMQRQAATEIARHESLTGRELDDVLKSMSAHKRLSELEDMGVIYVKEVRPCRITGRDVEAWAMTGKKAVKVANVKAAVVPKPTKTTLRRCLPALRRLYLDMMTSHKPDADAIEELGRWIASTTQENNAEPPAPMLPPPTAPESIKDSA